MPSTIAGLPARWFRREIVFPDPLVHSSAKPTEMMSLPKPHQDEQQIHLPSHPASVDRPDGAAVASPLKGGFARRALWSFGGQLVSSSGNFLVTALVLTVASQDEFATFSLCLTTYLLLAVLYRALVLIPVTLLYSDDRSRPDATEEEERAATGLGVMTGGCAALIIAALAFLVNDQQGQFIVLAAAVPFLFYQDSVRYVSFARGCPSMAAFSDGLWFALQLAGSGLAFAQGWASAQSLFAVWVISGAIAGVVAGWRLRLLPRVMSGLSWLRRHWHLCSKLFLECLITSGGYYATLYGLVLVSTADQLGYLKAAQTLLGPVSVLLLGGAALGVPESVRSRSDVRSLRRFSLRLSFFLAAVSLLCGTVVYMSLPSFGPSLFPSVWSDARPLIPLLIVFNSALGMSTGPIAGVRALGDSAWVVRGRTASSVVVVMVGLPAAAFVGANGALIGLALAEVLLAVAAWRRFHDLLSRPQPVSDTA